MKHLNFLSDLNECNVGHLVIMMPIMNYSDCNSNLDTPKKILKVNHVGEFGAVNLHLSAVCS